MNRIHDFHMELLGILLGVLVFLLFFVFSTLYSYGTFSISRFYLDVTYESRITRDDKLEHFFVGIPALILLICAFPSLSLLYKNNDYFEADYDLGVGITGHQ